jgi:hypothetical protein
VGLETVLVLVIVVLGFFLFFCFLGFVIGLVSF